MLKDRFTAKPAIQSHLSFIAFRKEKKEGKETKGKTLEFLLDFPMSLHPGAAKALKCHKLHNVSVILTETPLILKYNTECVKNGCICFEFFPPFFFQFSTPIFSNKPGEILSRDLVGLRESGGRGSVRE